LQEFLPSISLRAFSSRALYTIPESSETNTTTTNTTVNTNSSSIISATNIQTTTSITTAEEPLEMNASQLISENISVVKTSEDDKDIIDDGSLSTELTPKQTHHQESSGSRPHYTEPSLRNDQDSLSIKSIPDPSSSRAMVLVEDDDDGGDEDVNTQEIFTPIYNWPASNTPCEPQLDTALEGNETACKIKFCNMLIAAYQQHQQRGSDHPKQMRILFNEKNNIKGITVILKNGSREDYLEFGGYSIIMQAKSVSFCLNM
jgi:hypothetical protein